MGYERGSLKIHADAGRPSPYHIAAPLKTTDVVNRELFLPLGIRSYRALPITLVMKNVVAYA